ncbi:MAG: rod shape-determining protein RodA [Bacteroidetes bacterium]|nr:rod shape-determining protein RodA [Bacteroidota bacterium]
MRTRSEIIGAVDKPVLLIYLLLVLLGWINIYAANYSVDYPSIFDTSREYGMQFLWICIGLAFGVGLLMFSGEFFRKNAILIYGGVLLLLIAVLIFGREVNGAKSWFGVGGFGIQPSEFAKMATALVIAAYLSDINMKVKGLKELLITILLIGIPSVLILLQPDAGTLLVFIGFLLVMYREGLIGNIIFLGIGLVFVTITTLFFIKTEWTLAEGLVVNSGWIISLLIIGLGVLAFSFVKRFILPRFRKQNIRGLIIIVISSLITVGAITLIYQSDSILKPHHKTRIDVLFGHMEDPSGAGYNVTQSKTAIGSGGLLGKGFLQGVLTKYKYVPMQSTDFIFCTVGEEWGFIGSSAVLILFLALLLRIIHLAENQRSAFTRVYSYAVASIIFMHVLINVGMAIGLAPVIGIPLPFFSYGGSSFLSFTAMMFILLRLDSERLEVFR